MTIIGSSLDNGVKNQFIIGAWIQDTGLEESKITTRKAKKYIMTGCREYGEPMLPRWTHLVFGCTQTTKADLTLNPLISNRYTSHSAKCTSIMYVHHAVDQSPPETIVIDVIHHKWELFTGHHVFELWGRRRKETIGHLSLWEKNFWSW